MLNKETSEARRKAESDAAFAIAEAQRVVLLWQRPTIPDADIPAAIGVPPSVWAQLKAEGDTPNMFTLGRRLFATTAGLRAWLDRKAQSGHPGTKRLRLEQAMREREEATCGPA